ncbi:DUF1801 domain-containing protein [Algoriphagus sediminis]|uniref:DUF1801 domain-containing protein n=1 Tax=Algoriphagus sediminis TaxID=3057113 RepID=A0ABT7YFP2_9BACT|nr:DUF1801 domain-containing protein [Algoriphagus sediminis]MDN3205341.1 DUF1801 domain-containing protein [Algoriphagus sediminis]
MMKELSEEVGQVIETYPKEAQKRILELRELILNTGMKTDGVNEIEEALRWGEPSYLTKKGSTIRIAWSKKQPESFSIFFKCTSQLVPTFKALYPETFHFEGNREIRFDLSDKIPQRELSHCISMALRYHSIKHIPLLGN